MDDISPLYTTWPQVDTAERAPQTVMILKTTTKAAPRLRDRIAALHSYEISGMVTLAADANASHDALPLVDRRRKLQRVIKAQQVCHT